MNSIKQYTISEAYSDNYEIRKYVQGKCVESKILSYFLRYYFVKCFGFFFFHRFFNRQNLKGARGGGRR